MILPSLTECTIAVRCCPTYFKLREDGPTSIISLPYRMVFAVATQHSILIYDTQQISPIAAISNIHYTRLTDLAWWVLISSSVCKQRVEKRKKIYVVIVSQVERWYDTSCILNGWLLFYNTLSEGRAWRGV